MKTKIVVLLGLAIALSGCTFKARLYPVQGPLTSKSPLPTYPVKMSGWIKSGTVVVTLDGGEVCSGRIAFLAGKEEAAYQTSASEPALKNLAAAWDLVYGPGFYTGQVLGGTHFAQGNCKSDRGTQISFQVLQRVKTDKTFDQSNDMKGVAIDSQGNIFKIAF